MLKNYFIVACRNFWRNKVFSIINILGLSIGISASLVIYLVVHYDFSFEKFRKDGDRIYRVVSQMQFPDQLYKNSGVSVPLPAAVRGNVPGIEESTAFWQMDNIKVNIPRAANSPVIFRKQQDIIFTDEHYFKFFTYQWLAGSPENALDEPNKVVLTESRAKMYFPSTDISKAIGQVIIYNDSLKAVVAGVVKDIDEITDFTFKEFISLPTYSSTLKRYGYDRWGGMSSAFQFFIRVGKNIKPGQIEKSIKEARKKAAGKEYLETDNPLQPLSDLHFNETYGNYSDRLGNKKTLFGLVAVATFLLLLGCINFINLTTAQASRRAREIGIRKTMGSSLLQLVAQFLGETFLLTLMATCLSVALTPWILHIFSGFVPSNLSFNLIKQPNILIFILALMVLVSLLSGIYPAFILSRYQPAMVLKNATVNTAQGRKAWLRKTLTVSQFVIAQFFIIITMLVGKQIRYSLNTDMGFKKDAIISFLAPLDLQKPDNKQYALLAKLKTLPGIQKISLAGAPPASNGYSFSTMDFEKDGKKISTTIEMKSADTNYVGVYNLKILAGRNLQQSDTVREYLVNEACARFLGYRNPADIVGKYVIRGTSLKSPIVGLVADFHSRSMQEKIHPLALSCNAKYQSNFNILLAAKNENTNSWKKTISQIENAWKEIYPEQDFDYEFVDETIAKFYTKEQNLASLLNWCTGLAVFISCLGLLGLVIYTTTQRTKEIGVRKVLGASVAQIVQLLSKDFMKWVLLAFIIATPLAWWAIYKWLENYAYKTSISWWVFLLSGISMLIVALLTLSLQTIRSASANPVESLRTE